MTTYAADNAAIQYIGRISDVSTERRMTGGGTQMRFRMYGRSLVINANANQSGTSTMSYGFDGAAQTDYNFGSTGVQDTTDLLGAGSDGWHDVVIICKTANYYRLTIASAVTITADGTPQIAAHSEAWTVSKLGTTDEFTNLVSNATLGANKRGFTWGATSSTLGHTTPDAYFASFRDETVFFRASCTKIAVWHAGPGPYVVYRDGVRISEPVACTANNAPFALCVLAASEDGTEHEYRIVHVASSSNQNRLDAICIIGTFSSTAPTLGRRIAFIGDSTTECITDTGNSDQGYVSKLIGLYGLVGFNRGISGNTSAQMNTRLAADVLTIASLYAVVCVSGANDGAVADGTLQSTMQTMYSAILADDSATLVIVCETWPSGGNREGAVAAAAVAAVGNGRCEYNDTEGWIISTTGVDTHDGVHLNSSGGTKIAAQLKPILISQRAISLSAGGSFFLLLRN